MKDMSTGHPQEDVPVEMIIHYIVKDYRRMFEENMHLKAAIRMLRRKSKKEVLEKLKKLKVDVDEHSGI